MIDLSPLYDLCARELGDLNIEGAAVRGERFLVFHRGNADGGRDASPELKELRSRGVESMTGDRSIDVDELVDLREYDLGELGDSAVLQRRHTGRR